ncbi:hypothetical protein PQ465_11500 [Sphingobacterium oryzagri]|uniref:Uncharacterized protein n=1 Tax=Sphingobacterium oryzagri TaxID=3025669 RepID=A0ABY7WBA1_9SPHI|nr:hypothetical protein [Sphingobacterium sp. KACC 22765]WDF66931.1 hypothetical protein PQ465_11500 [Sphingobacterium sp. KACC 22765]
MNKIIKTMPLMALLLGAGIFTVDASFKTSDVQENQQWLLETGGDRTDPADYVLTEDASAVCQETNTAVCGVNAPASSGNPNIPSFNTGLQTALNNNDTSHPAIMSGPRTP